MASSPPTIPKIAAPPPAPPPPVSAVPMPTAPPPATQARKRPAKQFSAAAWTGQGEGEKLVPYGPSGSGKTTLAAMAPEPLFLGIDDGGRKIRHPITGEPIHRVEGVETYEDVREAIAQDSLWRDYLTCVMDTGTILEKWCEPWIFATIPHEKGQYVTSLEGYGYGKGYRHLYDAMIQIFSDLDGLIRKGKNVIVLCQSCPVVIANPGGTDYLQDGPKLYHPSREGKQTYSVRLYAQEWADHVLKIDYLNTMVEAEKEAKVGRVKGSTVRAIYPMPQPHFFAKTRTLQHPVIQFQAPDDDALWRFLFPEHYTGPYKYLKKE